MTDYLVKPIDSKRDAHVILPGSKSITNRALILSALAKGESLLENVLDCDDTRTCMEALKTLGVKLVYNVEKAQCIIQGVSGCFPIKKANIHCHDSGITARFLLAICAQNDSSTYHFIGSSQLAARPMGTLIQALKKQGAQIFPEEATHFPVMLKIPPSPPLKKGGNLVEVLKKGGNLVEVLKKGGNLVEVLENGKNFEEALERGKTKIAPFFKGGSEAGDFLFISGHESSQFISALLLAAPYGKKPLTLKTKQLVSEPYVHLTIELMKIFGVKVILTERNTFYIDAPQCYTAQKYTIEPDMSTASYFFAAAAITQGKITIPHINKNTCLQGDIAFLDILEKMGCLIDYQNNTITVHGTSTLRGITVNMKDISDTMMTLACIAPFAQEKTTITGIAHVRHKESDRIDAVVNNLKQLNIQTESGDDYLTIFPGKPTAGIIKSYHDHRIAMAFALIGLKIPGITIQDMQCVSKTFPEFTSFWENLSQ